MKKLPISLLIPLFATLVLALTATAPVAGEGEIDYETAFDAALRAGEGERALALARERMEAGDPLGKRFKIRLLATGIGVEQDLPRAVGMLEEFAREGDLDAQVEMSMAYQQGMGVEQDDTQAAEWMFKAAEAGDAEAQLEYARFLAEGKGVGQDLEAALEWAQRSADQGNQRAFDYSLGIIGKLVEADPDYAPPASDEEAPTPTAAATVTGGFSFEEEGLVGRLEEGNFVMPGMDQANAMLVVGKPSRGMYAETLHIAIWVRLPRLESGTYEIGGRQAYLESEPESGTAGAMVKYQEEEAHPRDTVTYDRAVEGSLEVEREGETVSGTFTLSAEDADGNSIEAHGRFADVPVTVVN